jgi:O-antigen/teichoic acid export membrane protein
MGINTRQVVNGTAWMSVSTGVAALFQILSLVVLTRFLTKSEFGIVAIVTMVLGIVHTMADLGFSAVVMHKSNLSEKEFSSLYWIQLILFAVIYLVSIAISPLIAAFYDEPSLSYLIPISLSALIFMGIGMLYNTMLQKNKAFKILAIRNIVASSSSFVLAVILAVLGFGVYSLILSTLFQTAVLHLWNFFSGIKYIKVQRYINLGEVKPLIKIGLYQTGTQLIDYISSKLDIIIIGKLLGADLLGVYNLVKELVVKVYSLLNSIANKVALPFFAEMQNDYKKLGQSYNSFISKISLINFPLCVLLGSLSPYLLVCLYGDSYSDAAPVLTIMAIWGMLVSVGNPINNIIVSVGRTDMSFKYVIIRLIITTPILTLAARYGLLVTALATLTCESITLIVSWYMELWKTIQLDFKSFFSSFICDLLLSIFIVIISYFCISQIPQQQKYIGLLIALIITLTLYFILYLILRRHRLIEMKNLSKLFLNNLHR